MGVPEGVGVYNLRLAGLATRVDGRTEGDFAFHFETGLTKFIGLLNADRKIWSEHGEEAASCCSTFGFLLTLCEARPMLSQAECEALGRAVLRFTHFVTQDLPLDPSTAAEIVRAFIREWHLRDLAGKTE